MSMYTGRPTTDKILIVRVIIAFVCVLASIYQIYMGFNMINVNNTKPKDLDVVGYTSLVNNDFVSGTIDNIIGDYQGADVLNDGGQDVYLGGSANGESYNVHYYLSVTPDKKIISYRTLYGTYLDEELRKIENGESSGMRYQGRAHEMKEQNKGMLNLQMIAGNTVHNAGLDGGNRSTTIPFVIDIAEEGQQIPERVIVFTFFGAVFMLVLAFLVMLRPLRKIIESNQARKGTYVPDLKVTKDDIIFENEGYYEGWREGDNDFFLNTEYNIRGEGDTSLMKSRMEDEPGESDGAEDEDDPFKEDKERARQAQLPPDDSFYYNSELNSDGNFFVSDKTEKYSRRY